MDWAGEAQTDAGFSVGSCYPQLEIISPGWTVVMEDIYIYFFLSMFYKY